MDEGTNNFNKSIQESDFIILCSPVNDIVQKLKMIKKIGDRHILITDVGSTKTRIVKAAQGLNFIGSHPLAGSQQSGLIHAKKDLFKDVLCILTPKDARANHSFEKVKEFWTRLGSRPIVIKPQTHDRILAFVSHLPHVIAFSLIQAIPKNYLKFGATGLKDTTRIALSPPEIWADIFLSNKKDVLAAIEVFIKALQSLKKKLLNNNRKTLTSHLSAAQKMRMSLNSKP